MHLYPEFYKKQPIPFNFLQRQLATLEYEFSENKPFWGFIDSLRLIFNVLPKPKRYDLDKRIKPEGEDATFSAHQIMQKKIFCIHCWRMVYRYPSQNGKHLCEAHDMPSTSSEYKRLNRLIAKASSEGITLFNALLVMLKQNTINRKKYCADKFALLACLFLPNMNAFLIEHFASIGSYTEEGFSAQ